MKLVKPTYVTNLDIPATELRSFEATFADGSKADILAPGVFDALAYAFDNDLGNVTRFVEA